MDIITNNMFVLETFYVIEISLRTLKRRLAQHVLKKPSIDISNKALC